MPSVSVEQPAALVPLASAEEVEWEFEVHGEKAAEDKTEMKQVEQPEDTMARRQKRVARCRVRPC